MQPIATPVKTIDSTIGSRAVARSQVERAVLKRIGLDHHHFLVRVAVVLIWAESDVAVHTRESFELIKVADDLLGLGADGLHSLGNHPWAVITECYPPQQRVAHIDLGGLEALHKSGGALGKFSASAVADVAEIVRIDLRPEFRLFQ